MSMVTLILILIFGLNPLTGKISYGNQPMQQEQSVQLQGQQATPQGAGVNIQPKGGNGTITPDAAQKSITRNHDLTCRTFCKKGEPCTPSCLTWNCPNCLDKDRSKPSNGTSVKIDGCMEGCVDNSPVDLKLCNRYAKKDNSYGYATCPQKCEASGNARRAYKRTGVDMNTVCYDERDCSSCPKTLVKIEEHKTKT